MKTNHSSKCYDSEDWEVYGGVHETVGNHHLQMKDEKDVEHWTSTPSSLTGKIFREIKRSSRFVKKLPISATQSVIKKESDQFLENIDG